MEEGDVDVFPFRTMTSNDTQESVIFVVGKQSHGKFVVVVVMAPLTPPPATIGIIIIIIIAFVPNDLTTLIIHDWARTSVACQYMLPGTSELQTGDARAELRAHARAQL